MGYVCMGLTIIGIVVASIAIIASVVVGSGSDAHLKVENGGDE